MPALPADARHSPAAVTGLVLAGGQGRRMGGADKGLVELAGRPMIEHVLRKLRPQVGALLINANRHLDRYAAYGHRVIPDAIPGFPGPLAGVASALPHLASEFLLTVPCDAPLLPPDLARRLFDACVAARADIAVARDGQRLQPVFMLLRRTVAPGLHAYLADGGRRVDTWLLQQQPAQADFSDVPDSFVNLNEPAERRRIEALLVSAGRRAG